MGDFIKYRFPGETHIRKKTGIFRKKKIQQHHAGILLCTFDKGMCFHLEEIETEAEIHFSEKTPHIYSRSEYMSKAHQFKDELIHRKLSKAVFSRVKHIPLAIDPETMFQRLCDAYPDAFVYVASGKIIGTWIGASPELLLSNSGGTGATVALAGTKKKSDSSEWGDKEKKEQQYVVDFISRELERAEVRDLKIDGPDEFFAGPVKHLKSSFHFSCSHVHAMEIALRLHPTPAVSGLPVEESLQLIRECETHDRSLYAGMIGQFGRETQLFVNLRCAQLFEDFTLLYVGGGFTKDSDLEKEWEETENKAQTLLNLIKNE